MPPSRATTPSRASWLPLGAVALALGLYLGGVATSAQEHAFVPVQGSDAVALHADVELNLTAQGDQWLPAKLTIPAGKVVKLTLVNKDAGSHVFNQDDVGVAADLPAGATKNVWLKLDKPGATQWHCEMHSTAGADGKRTGMVGDIAVA